MNRAVIFDERRLLPASPDCMREQVNAIQKLMEAVMKEGEHYGRIPGSRKPSLWKPGAEKLCVAFHIEPSFVVEDLSTPDSYRYRVKCVGTHQITGAKLGEGMGACSSLEQRYRWRKATDAEFDATPEDRRRFKYGYDWEKKRPYEVKQVRAEHHDLENTILKMACKRAHVAMILNVTAASDIFTQDLEDLPEHVREEGAQNSPPTPVAMPRAKAKAKAVEEGVTAGPTPEGKDPLLTDDQQRVLRSRMRRARVSQAALVEKFGVRLKYLPARQFDDVTSWVHAARAARP